MYNYYNVECYFCMVSFISWHSQFVILPLPTPSPLRHCCRTLSQKHLELHSSGRSGSRSLLGTAVCVCVWGGEGSKKNEHTYDTYNFIVRQIACVSKAFEVALLAD